LSMDGKRREVGSQDCAVIRCASNKTPWTDAGHSSSGVWLRGHHTRQMCNCKGSLEAEPFRLHDNHRILDVAEADSEVDAICALRPECLRHTPAHAHVMGTQSMCSDKVSLCMNLYHARACTMLHVTVGERGGGAGAGTRFHSKANACCWTGATHAAISPCVGVDRGGRGGETEDGWNCWCCLV